MRDREQEDRQILATGPHQLWVKTRRQLHYGLATDTPLTLIDWDGILVLSSRVPVVTELARQLAAERAAAGVTVDDLLTAWAQERYGTEVPPSTDDA